MDIIADVFKYKTVCYEKLITFGFEKCLDVYEYSKVLKTGGLLMTVNVSLSGDITAKIIDTELGEPYTLHLNEYAEGGFVGAVRHEYEQTLTEIAENCFDTEIFKSEATKRLIQYIQEKYGDELEYLWERFPENAICRRKDNQKWYLVVMTVKRSRLGLESNDKAEVAALRVKPEEQDKIIDNVRCFQGYHMNKKRWITVILDGSLPFYELCQRVDESYVLAGMSK